MKNAKITTMFVLVLAFVMAPFLAQAKVTSPQDYFGHQIGADYVLLNYQQLVDYWRKLAAESERMSLVEIGKTAKGQPMWMAIISSPENHKKLDHYKEVSRRLCLAEGLRDEEARRLAQEGKAVVWIDGGLHATETVNAQNLFELAYHMTSRDDPETIRILNDVILLASCTNPDGMDFVSDWYMRVPEPSKRSYDNLPSLYHHYVGHDNNRDSYMVNMPETEAVNRVLYREWFPQIMYNQHQTGPRGTVIFMPPYVNPFNYFIDPLVIMGIDLVAAAMHNRYLSEGKPGAVMREEANYQTWWNGGYRTTPYFHNMIGILTEVIGQPNPIDIPFLPNLQVPHNSYPWPIAPQKWHYRQSIDYIMSASLAVLDVASRYRSKFLYDIYRMGLNSIERGSRDHWTMLPSKVSAVESAIREDGAEMVGKGRERGYPLEYYEMLLKPGWRDPRGYVIPSNQPDFLTATKFVNALIKNGIAIHRANQPFPAGNRTYPEGSYVVHAAQAFRPHILDMFEPQDYPNDIPCPDGPPKAPYDSAGYTLAYQMGVEFDRILDGFDGPFEIIEGFAKAPSGNVTRPESQGFLLSSQVNDAFLAVNRLLTDGEKVFRLGIPLEAEGVVFPVGTFYIPTQEDTVTKIEKMAREIGLDFVGIDTDVSDGISPLKPMRIGLWDRYGGSMPSGWVRWILENYEFKFNVIFSPELDAGNLSKKYDILIFVEGAIPADDSEQRDLPDPESIPIEYRDRLSDVTVGKTVPQLRQFLNDGGTIVTVGSSTRLGLHLGLPIEDALAEDGKTLPSEKFFAPGSVHEIHIDSSHPLAYGLPDKLDVYFNRCPVYRINPHATGVKKVAWYGGENPLRSGWILGHQYLENGVVVIEACVGKGTLFMFSPLITFRAQSHGSYKLLFNSIYYGTVERMP